MKKTGKPLRPRPDVYQQALAAAKKRLEKALAEKEECRGRLMNLNEEIPRLQKIIDAFEPLAKEPEATRVSLIEEKSWGQAKFDDIKKPDPLLPTVRPSLEALKQVPDHLKRFMQPVETEVMPDGTDPDRFLPDVE